jgi:dihydrofolate synthase/folylpolyglutamate synthase
MDPTRIELGLERVKLVWNSLPELPERTRIVVIGGTNGKGSCALALEHMLREVGLGVGTYLSPHLVRFNERIRLNKNEISDISLTQHLEIVEQARGTTDLTYFEFTTLAALSYFAAKEPDVIILEVGLGGRLDAVNILPTDIAILVSVGLDHQDWLGNDLESIGREKAGIFRNAAWAILGDTMPESVTRKAREKGAKLLVLGKDFDITDDKNGGIFRWGSEFREVPNLPVSGSSLATAICAMHILTGSLDQAVLTSLANLKLPARFQRINIGNREFILDCAHNPAAAENLSRTLDREGEHAVDVLLGMMSDKDTAGFVRALTPQAKRWLTVMPESSRAQTTEELGRIIRSESSAEIIEVGQLKQLEIEKLAESRPTLVCGSFYTVGEFLKYHAGETSA